MDIINFKKDLESAFTDYKFRLLEIGSNWIRIFIEHEGITLGRISIKLLSKGNYEVYSVKFYKPDHYKFEDRDRFFYLFPIWLKTKTIPDIDFTKLMIMAIQNKHEKVEKFKKWRKEHPKKNRRPALNKNWMGEFRKLVHEELQPNTR